MPPGPIISADLLEEPLIRTPFELLRRSHKAAQRQVEKDFNFAQATLQSLLKSLPAENDNAAALAASKLNACSDRFGGLKRKLDDLQPTDANPTALRSRLDHLQDKDKQAKANSDASPSALASSTPERTTLDRYIVDHLLRSGKSKSAQALAASQGIEPLVDIKLFAELEKIESALSEKHSCLEALAWCGENRGTLKKTSNDLEFLLRKQEYIELCRKRDVEGAIAYSRKSLAPWVTTHMRDLQQVMTLLAFGETTGVEVYKQLYDASRWNHLRKEFRSTFFALYSLPSQSLLSLALSAGLASLRLPSCSTVIETEKPSSPSIPLLPAAPPLHNLLHRSDDPTLSQTVDPAAALHDHPETQVGNVDCPTCNKDMRILVKDIPFSHHVNSSLVCRISGEVMDSNNEPMAFPNGYVYSSKALQAMAKANFDVVRCPRTGESCAFARLRKVYIS